MDHSKRKRLYLLAISAMLMCDGADAWVSSTAPTAVAASSRRRHSVSIRHMQPSNDVFEKATTGSNRRRLDTLAASSLTSSELLLHPSRRKATSAWWQDVQNHVLPVLSASLLITGNTVGAGMLVLPDLAAGPGLGISTTIFAAAYVVNWISGVLIAEVAITQHDASGDDVPSSFQEFAQANLPMEEGGDVSAANWISGISVMVNALVLAFNMAKVGEFGAEVTLMPGIAAPISAAWAVGCVALVGTQSFTNLSSITSVLVFGLFASFAGLLLPGLAHMEQGPMELLLHTPGTSPDIVASACQLAPIVLMSLVYQNIVPTVTKMLDYDRTKSMTAISLGSFLPLGMYIAWAFCVVGGGLEDADGMTGSLLEGSLMTLFTLTTIAGSSIGCVMSLAEEFDSFGVMEGTFGNNLFEEKKENENDDEKFAFTSVLLSVASAAIALQFFQQDLNGALKVAGSFGSPLLYGVFPVIMAYNQRQARASDMDQQQLLPRAPLPLPLELPNVSLGLLGVASTGFVGNELLQSAQDVLSTTWTPI